MTNDDDEHNAAVLSAENVKDVEFHLEGWRRSMEDHKMKISSTKMEYMSSGAHDDRVKQTGVGRESYFAKCAT